MIKERAAMTQLTERMRQANLTAKEQAVLEKILGDISKTVFLRNSQMAEICGVSATYITRLVHKLGYTKFSEFKEDLSQRYRIATSPDNMFKNFSSTSGMSDAVKNSIMQDLANLSTMEKLLDLTVLNQVVDAINSSRKVYGVAMFASEVAVQSMGHYLWRVGKEYEGLTGLGLSKKIEFSDIGKGDVLLAFSSQRVLKEVRDAAVLARRRGAVAVAVTDNAANPLACVSDYVLLVPVNGLSVDYSHVATLAMINLITNSLAQKHPDIVQQHLDQEIDHCRQKDIFCLSDIASEWCPCPAVFGRTCTICRKIR